jgi:molybdopterin-guanine dinucleotide biosynthesis protein A
VLTVPGDAPFLPRDLVQRLHAARLRDGARFACAASGGQAHPVAGLWPVPFRGELRRAVAEQGVRRVDAFTGLYPCPVVEWPTEPVDPFFNVNTPEDLAEAGRLVAAYPDL